MTAQLAGVVTQNMGEIVGPKNGPRGFPLTLDAYLDKLTSLKATTARMLFNVWPSDQLDEEFSPDSQNPPAYWPPFSYDPLVLAGAFPWIARESIATGVQRRTLPLGPNGVTLVWQAVQGGVTGDVQPTSVNGNGDGTTTDGSVKWKTVNATQLTDADWADWTAKVLFPSVDGALARGLKAIICLNSFGDPVLSPTMQGRHLSFWGRVAVSKYANDPRIAFENHGEIIRSGDGVWAGIQPLFQATLNLVRKTASNLFITSTPGFCGSPRDAMTIPLIDPLNKVAYAYHAYSFNTPVDMVYARQQMSGPFPVAVTEWGDSAVIYVPWQTYALGWLVADATTEYLCVQSVDPVSVAAWKAGTKVVGQRENHDAASWECTVAGTSTKAPAGNSFGNPGGGGMDDICPDGTGPGVAHWKCLSCRDRDPATNRAFWKPVHQLGAWFTAFTALLQDPTINILGATAWAVSYNWSPGIYADPGLTTLSGWGGELVPFLAAVSGAPVTTTPVPTPPPITQTAAPALDLISAPATSTDPILLTVHLAAIPPPPTPPPPPPPAPDPIPPAKSPALIAAEASLVSAKTLAAPYLAMIESTQAVVTALQ